MLKAFLLVVCCAVNAITLPAQSAGQRQIMGRLAAPVLNEVSGVAASQLHRDILYVHNDSGDSARFFAITTEGTLAGVYYFKARLNGFTGALDCEDIAVCSGPEKGKSYVYLADIGDNFKWRSSVQVYRFKEPALKPFTDTVKAEVVNLSYPDGPHDAETLLADPIDKMLYIITKREDSVGVFSTPLYFKNKENAVLQPHGKLHFDNKGKINWIVSGAISADGTQVLLKSLTHVYYWQRQGNEPVYTTLQRSPVVQSAFVSHGQEEGISFSPDGKGYFITAEGAGSAIYYYTLEK